MATTHIDIRLIDNMGPALRVLLRPPPTLERVVNAMRIAQLLEPDAARNRVDALRRHAVADFLHRYEASTPRTCWPVTGPAPVDRLPWAEC